MSAREALQRLADLQMKIGDTLNVLWETESWKQPYKQFWCTGIVVAQRKEKTYMFYDENELAQYYGRCHRPLYVLQDLSRIQWHRIQNNSELFEKHKQLLRRSRGNHVVACFNEEN